VIVVDLGCADRNNPTPSLQRLAEMYQPEHIYGFDPAPWLDESVTEVAGVPCTLERKAAWTHDGTVSYQPDKTSSHIFGEEEVPCFDFAQWLMDLGQRVVVKMDIEGAEYVLIGHLRLTGTDRLIDELLVEWHPPRCEVREWTW
jgi:FkbM family methyltransferase